MLVARCLQILWGGFIVIWLLGALRTKRDARRVAGWPRILQIVLVTVAVPLFAAPLPPAWLSARFAPDSAGLAWLGAVISAAGIGLALWARFVLGRNWSSEVTVKVGHELILRGPYRIVRHPIYSGILLALLGTSVCIGQVRGLVAFTMFFVGWLFKARAEEALMIEQFGDQYRAYKTRVKALIPFVM